MVPSSVVGLVLFVVLLTPGFAYVLRHERSVPGRQFSALRETLRVVFVSLVSLLGVGLLFALLRWIFPTHTPNIRGLVQDPAEFARSHHVQLAWWSLALLCAATLLAAGAADPRLVKRIRRVADSRIGRLVSGAKTDSIRAQSHWHRIFELYADDDPGPILAGIQLEDGSYITGRVCSYNTKFEEVQDREIVLQRPLTLTPTDGDRVTLDFQFTVVSARRMVRMDVTHLPAGYVFPEGSVDDRSSADDETFAGWATELRRLWRRRKSSAP
jgi:hypothetical protein